MWNRTDICIWCLIVTIFIALGFGVYFRTPQVIYKSSSVKCTLQYWQLKDYKPIEDNSGYDISRQVTIELGEKTIFADMPYYLGNGKLIDSLFCN